MEAHVDIQVKHPGGRRHGVRLKAQALELLRALKQSGTELSIALVTDLQIQRLNKKWRQKNTPTDVLSFPADALPPGTPGLQPLGDVIISLDTARRQAREYARPLAEELSRYLAHGVLHLLGHDHLTPGDARKMARLEDLLLGRPGMVSTSDEH